MAAKNPYRSYEAKGRWFKESVGTDDSTRTCRCGDSFTWTGYDPGLEAWMEKHRRHAGKEDRLRAYCARRPRGAR